MNKLSLESIETRAGDKTTKMVALSPVSFVLMLDALDLLLANLWLFENASDDEFEALSLAHEELLE